jgi:hypothetical protein
MSLGITTRSSRRKVNLRGRTMSDDPIVPTAEQTAAAFAGPAFGVTNFMIHPISAGMLRLSFVEAIPLGTAVANYRTAVVLDQDGARNLAELLMRFVPAKADAGG